MIRTVCQWLQLSAKLSDYIISRRISSKSKNRNKLLYKNQSGYILMILVFSLSLLSSEYPNNNVNTTKAIKSENVCSTIFDRELIIIPHEFEDTTFSNSPISICIIWETQDTSWARLRFYSTIIPPWFICKLSWHAAPVFGTNEEVSRDKSIVRIRQKHTNRWNITQFYYLQHSWGEPRCSKSMTTYTSYKCSSWIHVSWQNTCRQLNKDDVSQNITQ